MIDRLKVGAPWYLKVPLKLGLSKLPVSYRRMSALGIRRFGEMTDPAYACEVFEKHARRAGLSEGATVLELGPGDSLATAVIAAAWGGERSILVDEGRFATDDLEFYRMLAGHLAGRGLSPPALDGAAGLDELLGRCGATYLTEGRASLEGLSSESVDFVFSNAVLEHVRARDFEPIMRELRRVLGSGGRVSHTIDLRDHLGDGLNHMRFSRARWESPLFVSSGFYTNRLTYPELLDCFERTGFVIDDVQLQRWPSMPTPRSKLKAPFRYYSEEALTVSGVDVLLSAA